MALNGKKTRQKRRERHVLTLGHNQRKRVEVECRELVVMFFNRGKHFIAEAKVQRQPICRFPIVLGITSINLSVIINVMQAADIAAVRDAEQESRKSTARE